MKSYVSFGKNNGDIVTGMGAVEIYFTASSAGSTEISSYLTNQSYDIDVGSLTQHQVLTAPAAYNYIGGNSGFLEFPFNRYAIFTTDNINVNIENESGVIEYKTAAMTPLQAREIQIIPLDYRLSIQGTIVNQNLTILYIRQD